MLSFLRGTFLTKPLGLFVLLIYPLFAMGQVSIPPANTLTTEASQTSTSVNEPQSTFSALDTNYQPRCSGYGGKNAAGTVGGAKACLDFLNSRGGNECRVSRQGTSMCTAGGTAIYGIAAGRQQTASSSCRDVAYAVKWVLDHCSRCGNDGCSLIGSQAAWANGDLIVVVGR